MTHWRCSCRTKTKKTPEGCNGTVIESKGVFKVTMDHKCIAISNIHKWKKTLQENRVTKNVKKNEIELEKNVSISEQNTSLESTSIADHNTNNEKDSAKSSINTTENASPLHSETDDGGRFTVLPHGSTRGNVSSKGNSNLLNLVIIPS